jgi:hypothetical protein
MANTPGKPGRLRRVSRAQVETLFPHLPKPSQVKTFYAAAGRTISAWQLVESCLYEIYRATTRATLPGAEAAAYYAIGSFRAQLRVVDAAVGFVAMAANNEKLAEEWATLRNRAGKKSDRRNQIAHGAVWTMYQEPRRERKIYIGPNMMDTRVKKKQGGQDAEPLTLKRVKQYENDFRLLAAQLLQFSQQIPQLP